MAKYELNSHTTGSVQLQAMQLCLRVLVDLDFQYIYSVSPLDHIRSKVYMEHCGRQTATVGLAIGSCFYYLLTVP